MTLSRRKREALRRPAPALPAARPAAEAAPAAGARPPGRGAGRLSWILFAACLAWAVAASAGLIASRREAARLSDEAAVRQAASEDKVRALTRRLVGVASHQVLEQEGLTDRLADIVARQVALENREASLAALVERALAAVLPVPPAPEERPARPPGRSGALTGPGADPAAQSLRGRFARIETSLDGVEAAQGRLLARLGALAQASVAQVRTVLAELQLALAPPAVPRPPAPRDPFERDLAGAEAALSEAGRWRGLAEGLPLRAPIEGEAPPTSNFGQRKDPFTGAQRMHAGMDFRSAPGTPVHAAAAGRVVTAGPSGGYGTLVEIDHGHDVVSRYGHLSAVAVHVAQAVPAGAVVGQVGSTGRSTGPHLHYETRLSGTALDPGRFLAAGRTLFRGPRPAPEPPAPAAEAQEQEPAD